MYKFMIKVFDSETLCFTFLRTISVSARTTYILQLVILSFELLKPEQELSGFIDKLITLGNGSERGIIKDKDDMYKILPESKEVKNLERQFVTASLGNDGKLNS
jgi:hypothetical protein